MSQKIKEIYDPEYFRENGHQLIDMLANYLSKTINGVGKSIDWHNPQDELRFWQEESTKKQGILSIFEMIIARSVKVHHPKYVGHQVSPPAPVAVLADMVSALLNNGMAVYEMGMASTALEKEVIRCFTETIGYSEHADGFLTSGGTLANLTALLSARKARAKSDIWNKGHGHERLAIMVSSEAHYCVDRAARIMGLGSEGILKIALNDNYQMDTDQLEYQFNIAQSKGLTVFAVIGSACSTSTGAYDDLEAISTFAEKHNLWFHVDGAHGGAVAFSPKYKTLVNGLNQADSVVIDCHKLLMTPAVATALLFKKSSDSYNTFHQKAQYLWAEDEEHEWFNLGKRTFECTKLMMSIKFYAILKAHGMEAFDASVTYLYDLAKTFAKSIQSNNKLDLAVLPQSNIVCFRWYDRNLSTQANNTINAKIRQQILEEGEFYIVQTTLSDKLYLRTTLMNPFTTIEHLELLLDKILELAHR